MTSPVALSEASNTVAVHFQAADCPRTLEEATVLFSRLGDVARLDTSLGSVTGLVFVTFFDVRVAQKVLQQFGPCAEPFQPAVHDFRAVSLATSVFAELSAQFGGFQSFGEIAGVSSCGEDIVVEFYDMRAAHQATFCVPGTRPKKNAGLTSPSSSVLASKMPVSHYVSGTDWVQETMNVCATPSMNQVDPLVAPPAGPVGGVRQTETPKSGATYQGPGKPLREKVRTQDLSKFNIIPEKIRSGEDTRTTVMVRNIPKACSREAIVELLSPCGLANRYTFFYMPFDKRRNVHCGFAFINFRSPADVLVLFECMTPSFWRSYLNKTHLTAATMPAVSYARLQGHEQLTKHFSLSAVMRDSDARKRPVFRQKQATNASYEELESLADAALGHMDAELDDKYQPCYVSMRGLQETDAAKLQEDLSFLGPEGISFLLGPGCGA